MNEMHSQICMFIHVRIYVWTCVNNYVDKVLDLVFSYVLGGLLLVQLCI